MAEAGENFVADGAGGGCDLVNGIVGADQIDQGADGAKVFGNAGNVEGNEIHGYAPYYRDRNISDIPGPFVAERP